MTMADTIINPPINILWTDISAIINTPVTPMSVSVLFVALSFFGEGERVAVAEVEKLSSRYS
jgi:hypothetical protein